MKRSIAVGLGLILAVGSLGCGSRSGLRNEPADPEPALALACGADHTCALAADHRLFCWGTNETGQLGDQTLVWRSIPTEVQSLPSEVIAMDAGTGFTCAVTAENGVYCWGANDFGQAGAGFAGPSATPLPVPPFANDVAEVSTGETHVCSRTDAGKIHCWGAGYAGQLGTGTFADGPFGPAETLLAATTTSVSLGLNHTCAITAEQELFCWGDNGFGEIGYGLVGDDSAFPTAVLGLPSSVIEIAAGWDHTCALLADETARCWGNNFRGQLGNGTKVDSPSPTMPIDLPPLAHIATTVDHTCAVSTEGEVYCWGTNVDGQLGTGHLGDVAVPVPQRVEGIPKVSLVAPGHRHTCAAATDGGIWCWGRGKAGQLGNRTFENSPTPVPVELF